jgi:eukaryotic-like serine/threonine-protein kinase
VARALVATPAEELAPAISPDGRWLAYSSNETGRREIYVRPFPEADRARYQVSTAGGMTPVWNPTGHELFYVDAAENLVSVPLVAGTSFQTGPPHVLFPLADYFTGAYQPEYEVSRDGQRFLMIRQEAGTGLGVVVVLHFLDDLKRRMAAR